MKLTVRLSSLRLNEVGEALVAGAREGLVASAEQIELKATELIPKDTGNAAGTIETVAPDENTRIVQSGGSTEHSPDGAPYVVYLEWGTSKMHARPSLTPAAIEEEGLFAERIANYAREALRG